MDCIEKKMQISKTTVIAIATCISMASCLHQEGKDRTATQKAEEAPTESHSLLYGIVADSFAIENGTVRQGQVITNILESSGVGYQAALETYEKALPSFDFKKMRAGNNYYMFYTPDSAHRLRHFVYPISERSYIRCSFGDSISISREDCEVTQREKKTTAVIETSLWNAMSEQGISPQLALELSDIYAWTIDFFGIDKGDTFKILYTENYIGDKDIGPGNIIAAVYESKGRSYYAFRYEQDSLTAYYDMEGNSLRRSFLKAPLKYSRISSHFSNGRKHPILKIRRPHHGVDYAAPAGTPVYAIGDGKVTAKGFDMKGGGNYVKIKHNSVYTSVYMHLKNFANDLHVGQELKQGDLIGNVGSTGLATGPHLDFRIYMNGKPVDPLTIDAPRADPVSNDDIQRYIEYSDSVRTILMN